MDLICGINPVLEALTAGERHFDHLVIAKGARNRRVSEALGRASQLGVPLRFESREALDRLAGGINHQGLIAVVSPKRLMDVEGLLAVARDPALLVVLDGVEDPRNLGAILRTAEAAGADGVVLPERRSAPLSETVARSSAGALEHVRIARAPNLANALDVMKQRGLWIVGFDAGGSERWDAVDLKGPLALVLGGEGRGIRRLVRDKCDHLASLPLFGHMGSLNVSVAAGIALYEAIRQRGNQPSHVRPIPMSPARAPRIEGPAPDDAEQDPGRMVTRSPLEAPEGEDTGADRGPMLLIQEEAAWSGPGPTVLKRRPQGPRGRGRPGQPSGSRPSGPPAERRGRRRRGKGRGGAPAPSASGPAPPSQAPSPPSPPERAAGSPAGDGARRRRRRRRRG